VSYNYYTRTRAPRGTFVPSPVFFGIVAVWVAAGALAWMDVGNATFNTFVFVVDGWLLTLCLHEYAHAVAAYFGGDYGVIHRGYLKLNPIKYMHPVLSIVLPVVFLIIGGIPLPGGAVMIDHHELKSKKWDTMVSLAGPAMNFVFALIMAVPFLVGVDFLAHPVFWSALAALIWIEVLAAIFNLIPVPGLDGGNALYPWLSHDWRRGFDAVRPYAVLVVFLLLWQTRIARPFYDFVFWLLEKLNVPDLLVSIGLTQLLFWKY